MFYIPSEYLVCEKVKNLVNIHPVHMWSISNQINFDFSFLNFW